MNISGVKWLLDEYLYVSLIRGTSVHILPLHLFEQEHSDCGIASLSSVVNYYNPKMNYKKVKKMAFNFDPRIEDEGTCSGQLGLLCNKFKFKKVTIYSSNHEVIDYGWKKKPKDEIKANLKEISIYGRRKDIREDAYWYYRFLNKRAYDNNLIVSSDFANIIKNSIDNYKPVLLDYNWSQIFNKAKVNRNDEPDHIRGDIDYHAVVVVGYSKEKVCIQDSHNNMQKSNKVEPINNGCYYIKWEHLMVAMGNSDIIIPEKFVK